MQQDLQRIIQKYYHLGIEKGGELVLPPQEALLFVDDVAAIGIVILGLDGWYFVDGDKQRVGQDLDVDFYVGDDVAYGANAVHKSAAKVKEHILKGLPARTALVSFTLDVPNSWNFFPE